MSRSCWNHDKLEKELKQLSCHFTWDINRDTFAERREFNWERCQLHVMRTPNEPAALNFLGYLYVYDKKLTKAIEHFSLCLEHNPDDPVCLGNLAHVYFQQHERRKAQEMAERYHTLITDPRKNKHTHGMILWSRAYCDVRLFEYENAHRCYQEAYDLLNLPELLVYKATLYNRQKKYQNALDTLAPVASSEYQSYLMQIQLGRAYAGSNDVEKSIEAFEKALELAPDNEAVWRFYASSIQKWDPKLAFKLLNQAITNRPSTYAYHHRAQLHLYPNGTDGKKTKRKEAINQAIADLEKAVDLCAGNFSAGFQLIKLYLKKEGVRYYKNALAICKKLNTQQAELPEVQYFYYWGLCLLKLGETEAAEEKFYQSLTGKYSKTKAHNQYDRICQKASAKELRQLIHKKYKPNQLEYWESLSFVEVQVGNRPVAKITCQKGLARFPNSAELYFALARVLVKLKEYAVSVNTFKAAWFFYTDSQTSKKRYCIDQISYAYLKEAQNPELTTEMRVLRYLEFFKNKAMLDQGDITYLEFISIYNEFAESHPELYFLHGVVLVFASAKLEATQEAEQQKELLYKTMQHIHQLKSQPDLHEKHSQQESEMTFDSENPVQLAMTRDKFIGLIEKDFCQEDTLSLRRSASYLIAEARKMLDYLFIKFIKVHFNFKDSKPAMFPRVPKDLKSKYTIRVRLLSYLETSKQPIFLGLPDFSKKFPNLFEFLLSIQPLVNPQYQWLDRLYELRNQFSHEEILPMRVNFDGSDIDIREFAYQAYFGVEILIRDFYSAYCQDTPTAVNIDVKNFLILNQEKWHDTFKEMLANMRIIFSNQKKPADEQYSIIETNLGLFHREEELTDSSQAAASQPSRSI